jgi:phospholipid/cholesterol/gamma-HCH transport system substrate-binding protein
VLGEHFLQIQPGPETNPELPSGAMIPAGSTQVVVEDLLESLDPDTRAHLASTVRQLDTTLSGSTSKDLNETLRTAGPAVQALGAVLNAVGQDGPAIRSLVTNLHGVTQTLAERRDGLSSTVEDLNQLTGAVAVQQQQLADGIAEFPSTLDALQGALDKFPAATEELVPLLDDLKPAADRLPGVAANLSPVLQDLRPTMGLLRPTLEAADRLLDRTPAFLDEATAVVPQVQTATERLAPAVAFLRPYTPEIMGFASNWGNVWSTYDSQGHFAHPLVVTGKTAVDNNPNVTLPGEFSGTVRLPGESVGQPWTDANGSAPR